MNTIPEKELIKEENFSAFLAYADSGLPSSINIKRTGGKNTVLLSFGLDVVDAMGFCDASPVMKLPEDERGDAVHCLAQALQEKYGGKNMLAVPDALVPAFKENGFDTFPKIPGGASYGRLLVSDTEDTVAKVREIEAVIATRFLSDPQIITVTDKEELLGMKEALSILLIDNAPYATGEHGEKKRPFYTSAAMQGRIEPENVHAIAFVDKDTGKPVAFMRSYVENGVGTYVSDLVVDKDYRRQGLEVKIMKEAVSFLPEQDHTKKLFVIAGDDKEQAFFESRLGFASVATMETPVEPENGNKFMFRLIPKQEILLDLPEQLSIIVKAEYCAKTFLSTRRIEGSYDDKEYSRIVRNIAKVLINNPDINVASINESAPFDTAKPIRQCIGSTLDAFLEGKPGLTMREVLNNPDMLETAMKGNTLAPNIQTNQFKL